MLRERGYTGSIKALLHVRAARPAPQTELAR